jgi:serine phosphatase RsbU (regulator of sigma subunit)
MSRVRQAIVSVGINEPDPAVVLARANDILLLQDATMVTAVCGFIDLAQGAITYASAGHPPILLLRPDGAVDHLPAGGPPLGALDNASYESRGTLAEPKSMLVLYTDGLIEYNRDWTGGERKLEEAVRDIDIDDCSDPAAQIMQTVFEGEVPQDDVAILTVTFREAESPNAPLSADLTSSAVRPITDASVRSLLASVLPKTYAQAALVQLERPLVRHTTGRIDE